MAQATADRRRYGRIHLTPPLQGTVDGISVVVTELSVSGARVLHEARLPRGIIHRLRTRWENRIIELHCEIVRSMVRKLARRPGENTLYDSGLAIVEAVDDSDESLRALIADYVVRSLNEQFANARGVPPLAAYTRFIEKSSVYRRCELLPGGWRRSETADPSQPPNGFTIGTNVDPQSVDLLCRTWEVADDEGRRLTQVLAQLSTDPTEGIATRRYMP